MSKYENIGLLFNKHYFKNLNFRGQFDNSTNQEELKRLNKILLASIFNDANIPEIGGNLDNFKLTTTYPGLFTGSGYAHESSVVGEFKLGFFFDYTSGMPCIAGSSVKGVVHSVFPCKKEDREIQDSKKEYLRDILAEINSKLKKIDISKLEENLFNNEKASVYEKDIFFDAFPISQKGKFLGNDYITPHKDALKNPIPLQFLKVMPQVEFQFNFKLNDATIDGIEISTKEKESFFRKILLDFGIGAKTNVGYGQLEESEDEKRKRDALEKIRKAQLDEEERIKNAEKIEASKSEEDKRIVAGEKLKCTVTKVDKKKFYFKFDWSDIEFSKGKKKIKPNDLKVGEIVEIEINKDYYTEKEVSFLNNVSKT